ncbi:MAG: alanine dehydrogenase [Alphaproteobacteria bacterium CG_4_9_14_3_um_filter_47_13]|nr:MAG: alanine dehydrogenase [Alphaproteobacteria bacterium CG_4_9_14_3_um_filter_47_13]
MIVGCPKEIKAQEHRVGLVPSSVREYVNHGHKVIMQTGAGAGINFTDQDYLEAGAEIRGSAQEIFAEADMIVKVKEPQAVECAMLREGQILFTYLHLAADPEQARGLMKSGCVAIAYETVTGRNGKGLPLLAPMSEVAGRLGTIVGSYYLQKHMGGTGRLICGVPGVMPANVLVIGGGVAGFNAARIAVGMGANVTILEKDHDRIRFLDDYFRGEATVVYSSIDFIEKNAPQMDMIIGAVLIPGASAPKLVTREMLKKMAPGTVIVDIAIDQGGCFETSKPTTHSDPVYVIDDVVHYCVANMPGAVPLSSALALNHAVLPYGLKLADKGWKEALAADPDLRNGLNICFGEIAYESVAKALGLPFNPDPVALAV